MSGQASSRRNPFPPGGRAFFLALAGFCHAQLANLPEEFRGVPNSSTLDSLVPAHLVEEWRTEWVLRLEQRRDLAWRDAPPVSPRSKAYLSKVLETVLSSRPELRGKINVNLVSLPWVNAFITTDGTIFVNTGIMARLQDESQLAMVLAHEASHFVLHHPVAQWVEAKKTERGENRRAGTRVSRWRLDTAAVRLRRSRQHEMQADSLGYQLLAATAYRRSGIDSLMLILDGSDHAMGLRPWTRDAIPSIARLPLPDSVWLPIDRTRSGEDSCALNDSTRTHPAIPMRRKAFARWIGADQGGRRYLVDSAAFQELRKQARCALPDQLLARDQPAAALFEAWSSAKETPNDPSLRRTMCRGLTELAMDASGSRRDASGSRSILSYGAYQTLEHFLSKIDGLELATLATLENRRLVRDKMATPKDSALERQLWHSIAAGWPLQSRWIKDSTSRVPRVLREKTTHLRRIRTAMAPLPVGDWTIPDAFLGDRPIDKLRLVVVPPRWGSAPAWTKIGSRSDAVSSFGNELSRSLTKRNWPHATIDPTGWTGDSAKALEATASLWQWIRNRLDHRGAERWRPRLPELRTSLERWQADALLVVGFDDAAEFDPQRPIRSLAASLGMASSADGGTDAPNLAAAWFDATTGEGRLCYSTVRAEPTSAQLAEKLDALVADLSKPGTSANCVTGEKLSRFD